MKQEYNSITAVKPIIRAVITYRDQIRKQASAIRFEDIAQRFGIDLKLLDLIDGGYDALDPKDNQLIRELIAENRRLRQEAHDLRNQQLAKLLNVSPYKLSDAIKEIRNEQRTHDETLRTETVDY